MLAIGLLGPQYWLLFAWHELGRQANLGVDTHLSMRVPQKILKKSISLYYMPCHGPAKLDECEERVRIELQNHQFNISISMFRSRVKLKPPRPASKKSWISITVWTTTHTLYPPYHCVDHCAAKDIFKVSVNIIVIPKLSIICSQACKQDVLQLLR